MNSRSKKLEDLYYKYLYSLIVLGKLGAITDPIVLTTKKFGEFLGKSQQMGSKILNDLKDLGFIEYEAITGGRKIHITPEGRGFLEHAYLEIYKALHPEERHVIIDGKLFSGFGEGRYYIAMEEYSNQFAEKLGFKPFPGTLNLRLDENNKNKYERVRGLMPFVISGFTKEGRTFGDVLCWKVKIFNDTVGAIILPVRTHHSINTLEIIAPVNLREKYNLKDGDLVKIHVDLEEQK